MAKGRWCAGCTVFQKLWGRVQSSEYDEENTGSEYREGVREADVKTRRGVRFAMLVVLGLREKVWEVGWCTCPSGLRKRAASAAGGLGIGELHFLRERRPS
jgi:hypothetical protein